MQDSLRDPARVSNVPTVTSGAPANFDVRLLVKGVTRDSEHVEIGSKLLQPRVCDF